MIPNHPCIHTRFLNGLELKHNEQCQLITCQCALQCVNQSGLYTVCSVRNLLKTVFQSYQIINLREGSYPVSDPYAGNSFYEWILIVRAINALFRARQKLETCRPEPFLLNLLKKGRVDLSPACCSSLLCRNNGPRGSLLRWIHSLGEDINISLPHWVIKSFQVMFFLA